MMHTDLLTPAIELARGALHRIENGRGALVHCLRGRLWLTQEGEARDIVLDAGESATVEHDGLTILSALRDSSFLLLARDGGADLAAPRDWIDRAARRIAERGAQP
jgi:hypothetical protein